MINKCVALFLIHSNKKQVTNILETKLVFYVITNEIIVDVSRLIL
jgi:hypothetical protein